MATLAGEAPQIRPATLDDADEMAALHVRAWQVAYRGLMPQAFLDSLDVAERAEMWRRGLTRAEIGNGIRVAVLAGQIAGFAWY